MKRFITVLMSAMIALSMMPTMAFAEAICTCGAASCTHVAFIKNDATTNYYSSLNDAISNAKSGDTICIVTDLENIGTVYIDKDVTLDGCGVTISGNSSFEAAATNAVTITNVNFKNINNSANKLSAIYGKSLAKKLTITNCSFENTGWDVIQITPVAGAEITITGNTFNKNDNSYTNMRRYVHIESAQNVDFSAVVTDNVMYAGSPIVETPLEVYYFTDTNKVMLSGNYIQSPASCILKDGGTNVSDMIFPLRSNPEIDADDYNAPIKVMDGIYNCYYYDTFEDAVKKATSSKYKIYVLGDVKLEDDVKLTSQVIFNEKCTLDLGGHKIIDRDSGDGLSFAAGEVEIKNGSVESNNVSGQGLYLYGTAKVMLKNVSISGNSRYGLAYIAQSAELTIDEESSISAVGATEIVTSAKQAVALFNNANINVFGRISAVNHFAISDNGQASPATTINIYKGTVESNGAPAIYHPGGGKLSINGGSIIGSSAVYVKSGDISISGEAVLNGIGEANAYSYTGSGCNSTGDALVIDTCGYPNGNATVSITGGTFTSTNAKAIGNYKKSDDPNYPDDTNVALTSFVSGGTFSSNPKAYVADGTNIYHQHAGNYFVGSMPASTSGYNAWALQNDIYEETYVAPAEPETPDAPVIDNSGSGEDAATNVDASGSTVVKDDKAETSIDETTGKEIVENAKENKSTEVVIKAETEKGEATGSTVALPESTVQALAADDVQASVTIKTDNATVTLDKDAVKATAEQAGTDGEVKLEVVTVEKTEDTLKVELKLVTSKGTVSDFKGGNVTVTVPVDPELAKKDIVCVYIDDNGKYTKMEGSLAADGKSYTFTTGHFSTYAILEKAEADAIIAEQNKPSDIASAKVTGVVNKTYTGKSITQNPVVTVGESKLVKGADYTVSYKNNVNAGVATLTIKGAGSYTGTITKTFKINPKGTSISKVTGQRKAVKVVWKKQLTKMKTSYVSGYQVQYSTSSKFTSGTSKYANAKFSKGRTTKTIKNLKAGKKYYVRVRTYKTVDGTKCYSSWSKAKSVKTK